MAGFVAECCAGRGAVAFGGRGKAVGGRGAHVYVGIGYTCVASHLMHLLHAGGAILHSSWCLWSQLQISSADFVMFVLSFA